MPLFEALDPFEPGADVGPQLIERVELARLLRESVIDLRQLLGANAADRHGGSAVLAEHRPGERSVELGRLAR